MMKKMNKRFNPMISVLVPIYNTKKYLCDCLKSLTNQIFKNFEILALDDGSTDGTSEILDQLKNEDERIKVVHKDNSGYGDTMNLGINMAKGKYIAILESDDYAELNMLKVLFDKAEQMNAELVLANYFIEHVSEDGLSLIKTESVENLLGVSYDVYLTEEERKKLSYSTPAIWRCLYKKEYLIRKDISFLSTPGAAFQDTSFFIKSVMMTEKAVYISDKVIHYRRGQISASVKDLNKVYCVCDELGEIAKYIAEKKLNSWRTTYPLILYIKYLWNYKRLSGSIQQVFLQRFKMDMVIEDLKGWLDKSVWPEWRYKQMIEVLDYDKIAPLKGRRIRSMNTNQYAKLNQFIAQLTIHDEIVLYGAGLYGDILLQRIYDWCLYKKIKFAVTGEPNELVHRGIDVLPIEYFKENEEDYIIVISVGETLTYEMAKTLDNLGITNYLMLDSDLRKILREDPHEQIEILNEMLKKEKEQNELFNKMLNRIRDENELLNNMLNRMRDENGLLNNMLNRMRDENMLLKEIYMKMTQLENRMDKLETFMRDEEICRLNIDKILELLIENK